MSPVGYDPEGDGEHHYNEMLGHDEGVDKEAGVVRVRCHNCGVSQEHRLEDKYLRAGRHVLECDICGGKLRLTIQIDHNNGLRTWILEVLDSAGNVLEE